MNTVLPFPEETTKEINYLRFLTSEVAPGTLPRQERRRQLLEARLQMSEVTYRLDDWAACFHGFLAFDRTVRILLERHARVALREFSGEEPEPGQVMWELFARWSINRRNWHSVILHYREEQPDRVEAVR